MEEETTGTVPDPRWPTLVDAQPAEVSWKQIKMKGVWLA